jgi:hypothetical protein
LACCLRIQQPRKGLSLAQPRHRKRHLLPM